jgi:carbon monoxide dehydrogenase subunit G
MATIQKEFTIDVPPPAAWAALRDFGALHEKLVPGFVIACKLEVDVRTITFFNGQITREQLIAIDDQLRRLAYSAIGGAAKHHNASAQVFDAGTGQTRFVWTTDVLPHELAEFIEPLMERGAMTMQKTLEQRKR